MIQREHIHKVSVVALRWHGNPYREYWIERYPCNCCNLTCHLYSYGVTVFASSMSWRIILSLQYRIRRSRCWRGFLYFSWESSPEYYCFLKPGHLKVYLWLERILSQWVGLKFWHFRVYRYDLIEDMINWLFHIVNVGVMLYPCFKLFAFIYYVFLNVLFQLPGVQVEGYLDVFIHRVGIAHIGSVLYCRAQVRPVFVGARHWLPLHSSFCVSQMVIETFRRVILFCMLAGPDLFSSVS